MSYNNKCYDAERALYGLRGETVSQCRFEGPADGESPLKECRDLTVEDSVFQLRYPLWHVSRAQIRRCRLTETCRAPLWYDEDVTLEDCELRGPKALRECRRVSLRGCRISSAEFGWMCGDLQITDTALESEYPFFYSRGAEIDRLRMKGKYSFQYGEQIQITNSDLDTKDAFWHCRNVTVEDSVIRGEYLGWYSENLHLIRCRLIGTQPLCYCKGLVLEDCTTESCDLMFENSEVHARVTGGIDSVKNPWHGRIEADAIGEVIRDEQARGDADCEIILHPERERKPSC